MRPAILLLLAAGVLTAVAVVGVVVLDPFADEVPPEREQPFATTPLDGFDTLSLTVPRAGFCSDVDPREVEAALGAEPVGERGYDNGDEVQLADGVTDVAHEFGCVWSLDDGSEARAWVFAPPVDGDRAQRLTRETTRTEGCDPVDGPPYGAPSVALLCTDGPLTTASYRGLFGDAWLTCELVAPAPSGGTEAFVEKAGAWCVAVARGASA